MKQLTPAFLTSMGLVLMAAALVGCHDDQCASTDLGVPDRAGYRNPIDGSCQVVGGRPGGGCDVDFQRADREALEASPDMAFCFGACEGSDEITCVSTDGCRANQVPPNMLVVFDRSGSMGQSAGGGISKLAVAQDAIAQLVTKHSNSATDSRVTQATSTVARENRRRYRRRHWL